MALLSARILWKKNGKDGTKYGLLWAAIRIMLFLFTSVTVSVGIMTRFYLAGILFSHQSHFIKGVPNIASCFIIGFSVGGGVTLIYFIYEPISDIIKRKRASHPSFFKLTSDGLYFIKDFRATQAKYCNTTRWEAIRLTGNTQTQQVLEIKTSFQGRYNRHYHTQYVPVPKLREQDVLNIMNRFDQYGIMFHSRSDPTIWTL